MFLDASAIIAMIAGESDAASLAARLWQGRQIADATAVLDNFLAEVEATVVQIDAACGRADATAFDRFGKGHHPAALNLGDCFAYACAQQHQVPLLCKGEDFPRTDIMIA